MSKVSDLHKEWSRDSDYRKAFDELKPEFDLARSLIEARLAAGLRCWPYRDFREI